MIYKYLDEVKSELTPFRKLIEDFELEFLQGYFFDLRRIKRDRILSGEATDHWVEIINDISSDLYGYITARDYWWELQFLKIRDKRGRVVAFEPNRAQRRMIEVLMRLETKPDVGPRLVLLKARQWGGSTLTELYYYLRTKHEYNSRAMIVADKAANSVNLFGMYSMAYTSDLYRREGRLLSKTLLYDSNPLLAVGGSGVMGSYSLRDLSDLVSESNEFENVLNGGYVHVESGFSKKGGRSWTLNYLHLSELAYWEDAESSLQSLLATVPRETNSSVIIESTGRGIGDPFHDMWRGSEDGYTRLFVPWYEIEEYSIKFYEDGADKRFEDSLTEDEIIERKNHGLTLEQLAWRREKIGEMRGNVDRFGQEYPATPEQAFLGSGRPVFAVPVLQWQESRIEKVSVKRQRMFRGFDLVRNELYVKGAREAEHRLRVWDRPVGGRLYVMGVDVSEGIEVKDNSTDFSVIEVLQRTDKELIQVAEFVGRVEPDVLATYIYLIADWYNNAWVNVEANNHGLTTIKELEKVYKKIMRRPTPELMDRRGSSGKVYKKSVTSQAVGNTQRLGWLTTSKSKPIMIDDLAKYLMSQELIVNSEEAVKQLYWYVYNAKGSSSAQDGKHDDIVIALALAVQGHLYTPYNKGFSNEHDIAEELRLLEESEPGDFVDGYMVV